VSAEFSLHVADCGYRVTDPLTIDGHIHRANWKPGTGKGDASWYIGFDHDGFMVILWGDWRDDFREVWTSRGGARLSQSERAIMKSDMERARAETEQTRQKLAAWATMFADVIWADSQLEPETHPYLTKKGITGKWMRWREFDGRPELLIPLRDSTASLRNLQRISVDGTKRFVKNGPVSGLWWRSGPMPSPEYTGDLAVVEGVATAETVRALSGLPTFAAITAGNLPAIVQWMRGKWPASRILIGADDDRWEKDGTPRTADKNVGRKKAGEAAEGTRALIILPTWNNLADRGTDWNDLAAAEGVEGARAKWASAVTVATLDRQVAGMSDTEYAARRAILQAAYRNAGAGAMGSRELDRRRREGRGTQARSGEAENGPNQQSPALVLSAICAEADLWHDQFGVAYATFPMEGIIINAKVESVLFKDWLRMRFDEETDENLPPSREVLNSTVEHVGSRARIQSPQMRSNYRMGFDGTAHWLDLGRKDWKMVRIDADGWGVFDECAIKFFHNDGDCALPIPKLDPNLDGLNPLWKILNVAPPDRCLVAGFLLGAMLSTAPCFGMNIYGGKGSAKSVGSEILRRLLDQNPALFQPINERNCDGLGLTCINQWIPCFENLSRLDAEVQDVFCSLTTKLAAKARKLYSDSEIVSYEIRRPWIINGINNVCTRSDLAERSIPLELLPAPRETRILEETIRAEFEAIRPHVLAVLIDAAVAAQKFAHLARDFLDRNKLYHRMADALQWITAGEENLGFTMGSFITRLNELQTEAGFQSLDGHPVIGSIESLVNASSRGYWVGTNDEILEQMHDIDPKTKTNKYLPHDAAGIGNWLRRETDTLRNSFGLSVGERYQRQVNGRRIWVREITRINPPSKNPSNDTDPD